mgnify:FL=1
MMKNIWYCIKKTSEWYFALLVLYIILTLVNAIIPILSAFLPKLVIERLTSDSDIWGLINTVMIFMGSIAVLTGVSKFLKKYLYFEKFSINVRYLKLVATKGLTTDYINQENGTFRKLQEESFQCCNGHSPLTQVYDVLQSLGTSVLGIAVFSAVLFKLNAAVILFLVVTTALSFYLNKRVVKWTDEHSKERMGYVQQLSYINAVSGDARSAKDIRLYPMAKWFSDIYEDNMKGIAAWYRKLTKKLFRVTACDGALGLLREGIIYLYLIYMFMSGHILVGDFVLYFGVVNDFSSWLSEIFAEASVLNQLSTKIKRFQEYLDFPEYYCKEDGVHPDREKMPKEIELKNVSFRYEKNQPYVLKNFSLMIRPGEHLAVVGLNGAGKTTLIKLICGLIDPTDGQVLYNGKPITEYNRVELYQMYSAVFQQFSIMPVTVEEIIAEAPTAQVDSERVKKCLELAGMWERIQKLPDKLQSQYGRTIYDEGIEFSGGETQKLLLARSIYKAAPILLLDEPTAALDPIAESELYQKYNQISEGKTAVFISHRLASANFCDRIILIENGAICEEGTHRELLAKKGKYYNLFEVQAKYYRKEEVAGE